MIELLLNKTPLNIPSSWNDITYSKYCDIIRASEMPLIERLHTYTGIESKILNSLTINTIGRLSQIVSFMDRPEEVDALCLPYTGTENIANLEYWKLEKAKQYISEKGSPIFAGADIVKLYTGEDITDKPILTVYDQLSFFLLSLKHSPTDSAA